MQGAAVGHNDISSRAGAVRPGTRRHSSPTGYAATTGPAAGVTYGAWRRRSRLSAPMPSAPSPSRGPRQPARGYATS